MHSHNSAPPGHAASEENHAARPHPEQVVLDIGGELGALIVHTDAAMLGTEIEISRTGEDERRSHKDVLQREINGRPAYTAVFDKVSAGSHSLSRAGSRFAVQRSSMRPHRHSASAAIQVSTKSARMM